MRKSIGEITSGAGTIIHSLVIPLFIFIFTIYYKPYGTFELLSMEDYSFAFNVTMLFCIGILIISITRGWLYLIAKYRQITRPIYLLWWIGEILVTSAFCALYIVLMEESYQFFEVAGKVFLKLSATSIYPYGFLWMGFELYSHTNEEKGTADDSSLMRFYDEYKKLRLVIAPEAILFIKSEDNYVQIHYIDQNNPKKFILRSSMRALEEGLTKRGLLRCHRSYFINPTYIKMVYRDSSGLIVAELKQDGYESIPISRKYHEAISRFL